MRMLCSSALLLILSLMGTSRAPAQESNSAPLPPDGGTTEVLQSIHIPPMPGAPFSCTLHTEWVRLLADGSTITLTNKRRIERDAQGRIFEERRLLTPPHGDADTPVTFLQYADPQAHTLYNCSPSARLCHLIDYRSNPVASAGAEEGRTVFAGGVRQSIDLGREMRDGIEVNGTRVITAIDKGVMGNSKPISVERQFWYSAALGINLYSLRSDPRFGVQSFTVTDLSRNAPDPNHFLLPVGYKVLDERPQPPKE